MPSFKRYAVGVRVGKRNAETLRALIDGQCNIICGGGMREDSRSQVFRNAVLASHRTLLGTFVKTPSVHVIEILSRIGFDFLVLDAEHAPFERGTLDLALLSARAGGIPAVVRVPSNDVPSILSALDDGAAGVLVPHVSSREQAEALVSTCRYSRRRGFSNSPRAGGYGTRSMWEHVDAEDQRVTVIAMIEDPVAVENIDEILSVDGLDAIFVGRGDLAVAMNDRGAGAPSVQESTRRVIDSARRHGKPVWLLPASAAEAAWFKEMDVAGFIVSSDQALMRAAALQTLREFADALGNPEG